MNFFIEWVLAVHRAIWFPVFWTLGLERPGIEVPLEMGMAIATEATPEPASDSRPPKLAA